MESTEFSIELELSDGGKEVNEDTYGCHGDVAWVLDGATGHRDEPITDSLTDGRWYVDKLDEAFRSLADDHESLDALASAAVERVREEFLAVAPDELDRGLDVPAAAGVLVRRLGDECAYLLLGDCTLLVEKSHTLARITDCRSAPVEQEQIEAMRTAFDDGVDDPWTARDRVEDVFLNNKSETNTPGGYWVFSLEPDAVDEALTGTFEMSPGTTLHLMTDGLSSVQDTYEMYANWEGAIAAIRDEGIESVVDQMRDVEASDPGLRSHPRTKPSDDATLLSLAPEP